ncbi:hypothetical protein HED22_16085 [Thalassospira sp. HF15]|uniref:hypothetical protein n=1 Tax=Thalassospira sp. HF15 TaxID=2722755 RepID=UPI0014305089|nr:hypothetical protein [Thalassospira sp. HF15]NIY77173.1 hypothetical protein [Thalassospira sp. HF15]
MLDVADLLFVLTVLAFSLLGEDAGAVDLGSDGFSTSSGRAAPGLAIEDFLAGVACFGASDDEDAFGACSAFGVGASLFAVTLGLSLLTAPLAAASISEDVITLRLGGSTSLPETSGGDADFDDGLASVALAVFPATFFLESVIASTS